MKSEILNRCIRTFLLILMLMLMIAVSGQHLQAEEQAPVKNNIEKSGEPLLWEEPDMAAIQKGLTILNRQSIKAEFADVQDMNKAVMEAFPYFSALTVAFIKRLRLQGVDQFSGEEDVWRIYYGGGSAAHSFFPEYFRLKREVMRRQLGIQSDDIQYEDLPDWYREADISFQKKTGDHRRDGLSPKHTHVWDNSTLDEIQTHILELDKEASEDFAREFAVGYHSDFSKVEEVADAIIRHEDRIWLFHKLGLENCLEKVGFCILSSIKIPTMLDRLWALRDDPVLKHYFSELMRLACNYREQECSVVAILSTIQGIKAEDVADMQLVRQLVIGVFHKFNWDGTGVEIPLTRLLADFNVVTLEATYRNLLDMRTPYWRYLLNENKVND